MSAAPSPRPAGRVDHRTVLVWRAGQETARIPAFARSAAAPGPRAI